MGMFAGPIDGKERAYVKHVVRNQEANAAIASNVGRSINAGEWPAIVFVKEVEHGRILAELIEMALEHDRGINPSVPVISSQTTTDQERAEYARRMREQDSTLPVVVATDVWSTGIDIPCLRAGHNAGDLQAPIGLRQRIGRPLRADEEKTFKWYDYVRDCDERYIKFAEKRDAHYRRAGFDITPLSAQLMQQVLSQPKPPLQDPKGLLDRGLDKAVDTAVGGPMSVGWSIAIYAFLGMLVVALAHWCN